MYSKKTPDDGQRNFPKRVEFYSKNKFEKLVRLVCFITRIDAPITTYYISSTVLIQPGKQTVI